MCSRDYTKYSTNLRFDKHGLSYIDFVHKVLLKGKKISHHYDYPIEQWGNWYVSMGNVIISKPSYGADSFYIVLKKGHTITTNNGLGHIGVFDENTYECCSIYNFSNTRFKELSLQDIRKKKFRRLKI